jgi:hypothetical protein
MTARVGWRLRLLIAWISCLSCSSAATAQVFESVGSRALGMGGAFVAVADDPSAVYWNPAGLPLGPILGALVEWSEIREAPESLAEGALEGSGGIVAVAAPALGVSYYRLRQSEMRPATPQSGGQPLEPTPVERATLVTHNVGVTLVQSLFDGFHVGTTLRFVRGVAATDRTELAPGGDKGDLLGDLTDSDGRSDNSFDLDLGVMASVGRLRVALSARNLLEPDFESAATGRLTLDRQVRAGVAFAPDPALVVALDLDITRTDGPTGERRAVALGGERWWRHRRIGVRGGVRADTVGPARPVAAAGASVALVSRVWIEGHVSGGSDDAAQGWGVAARVGF